MKVIDHLKYTCFVYESTPCKTFNLGEIVFKESELDPINEGKCNPIGVIIQTQDDYNVRTDMYGNVHTSEIRIATLEDIAKYLPELRQEIYIKPKKTFKYESVEIVIKDVLETYGYNRDAFLCMTRVLAPNGGYIPINIEK